MVLFFLLGLYGLAALLYHGGRALQRWGEANSRSRVQFPLATPRRKDDELTFVDTITGRNILLRGRSRVLAQKPTHVLHN